MSAPEPPWPAYPVINDPTRPAWHFGPPACWMNDPNGVAWHGGYCHVFYQHNPGGDEWADMHWGHARSRDLVHWEHLPIALRPQHADGEKHCYSGCLALTAAGGPRILYTSVPPEGRAATQVLAAPNDANWSTWTQHVVTPFLDLATHRGPAFGPKWRDPFVFRTEGRTFLILGATLGDEAVIPLYENSAGDLRQWNYRGILHRAPCSETPFFECPSLVRLGAKWALLVSPCREVEWLVGTLDLVSATFHVERRGRLDESRDFYATLPATNPQGHTVLFGLARNFPKKRGWNGCLGVPRRLWLDDAGDLCSEPVTEIAALRTSEVAYPAQSLAPAPLSLALPDGAMSDGELTVERSSAARVRLDLAGVRVEIDDAGVRFDDRPAVALADTANVHVRWLLDRSLLELFVNGRATCTRVVPFPPPSTASLSVTGGTARLVAGRAWALQATPPQLAI